MMLDDEAFDLLERNIDRYDRAITGITEDPNDRKIKQRAVELILGREIVNCANYCLAVGIKPFNTVNEYLSMSDKRYADMSLAYLMQKGREVGNTPDNDVLEITSHMMIFRDEDARFILATKWREYICTLLSYARSGFADLPRSEYGIIEAHVL